MPRFRSLAGWQCLQNNFILLFIGALLLKHVAVCDGPINLLLNNWCLFIYIFYAWFKYLNSLKLKRAQIAFFSRSNLTQGIFKSSDFVSYSFLARPQPEIKLRKEHYQLLSVIRIHGRSSDLIQADNNRNFECADARYHVEDITTSVIVLNEVYILVLGVPLLRYLIE